MWDRFTDSAKRAFVIAAQDATRLGSDEIRSEHLAVAIASDPGPRTADALRREGLDEAKLRTAVVDWFGHSGEQALSTIGLSLRELDRAVSDAFGDDALRDAGPTLAQMCLSLPAKYAIARLGDRE